MSLPFQNLFGIPEHEIKSACLLMPFLPAVISKQLGLSGRKSGKPYSCFQHPKCTIIETRIGPLFTGDAILNLEKTPCETIFFVGACGSLDKIRCPIGSIAAPKSCYALESFTQMLTGSASFDTKLDAPYPKFNTLPPEIEPVKCASIGSIALEDKYKASFLEKGIDVLEMECASVFAAAEATGRTALVILYVTDIIGESSPYEINDPQVMQDIQNAQNTTIEFILNDAL